MSLNQRWNLLIKQNRECYYCSDKISVNTSTIDHVIPLSKGGRNIKSNRVLTCKKCNKMKSNLTVDEFKEHISKLYNNLVKKSC